jgi:uncharacterized protein YceK
LHKSIICVLLTVLVGGCNGVSKVVAPKPSATTAAGLAAKHPAAAAIAASTKPMPISDANASGLVAQGADNKGGDIVPAAIPLNAGTVVSNNSGSGSGFVPGRESTIVSNNLAGSVPAPNGSPTPLAPSVIVPDATGAASPSPTPHP